MVPNMVEQHMDLRKVQVLGQQVAHILDRVLAAAALAQVPRETAHNICPKVSYITIVLGISQRGKLTI